MSRRVAVKGRDARQSRESQQRRKLILALRLSRRIIRAHRLEIVEDCTCPVGDLSTLKGQARKDVNRMELALAALHDALWGLGVYR